MPVGEELPFFLEPNHPPQWSQQPLDAWQQQMGPLLRLKLECHKEGRPPWVLPAELMVNEGVAYAEVPAPPGT